jgi:hypothetical protein
MRTYEIKKTLALLAVAAAFAFTGCTKAKEEGADPLNLVSLSGSLGQSQGQQKVQGYNKVSALALTDYKIVCVTFTATPYLGTSLIGEDGSFSLHLPANSTFGCFVTGIASQSPVASFVIRGQDSGFGASSSTSIALSSNLNLGRLTLDLETGEVEIPEAVVAPVRTAPVTALNPETLHNTSWSLSCVMTGDPALDADCADFNTREAQSETVFFRIMKAVRNGKPIYGLGVWGTEAKFQDCGSIDLTDADKISIQADGYLFNADGVSTGPAFNVGNQTCEKRDNNVDNNFENIKEYKAAGRLEKEADGYTLYAESQQLVNQGCKRREKTVVHFAGDGVTSLTGHFNNTQTYIELGNGLGDCSNQTNSVQRQLVIKFQKIR